MNFFSKTLLFITSYFPLFIIFAIINFDEKTEYYFKFPIITWWMIIVVIIALILVTILMHIILKRYTDFDLQNNIDTIENGNHEVLAYLFTYVIPFISVSDSKKIYIIAILMSITFIIFTKSELLKYNVFLLILGFDIIKVNLKTGESIFLLKKSPVTLSRMQKINYWKIAPNLYLLTEVTNG
jgi:uncharacterized membrane protein YhaH (DUF805 family)